MKIAIRVDSATMMGSGHVMRCLTLAERLRKSGANILFICRKLPGDISELISKRKFSVRILPFASYPLAGSVEDFIGALQREKELDCRYTREVLKKHGFFDWVIVDHYALDKEWEQGIRDCTDKIWVIDDLANRLHDCDVLLDQNYQYNHSNRYSGLVPQGCRMLVGLKYLLLREEFFKIPPSKCLRDGSVKRIQIFFGGSDPTGETEKAIEAIELLNRPDIYVDVIVGRANPKREAIKKYCSKMANVMYYCQVDNMAELMAEADLAIGAGGSTTWERCFVGLPALIIMVADNQRTEPEAMAAMGAFENLGWHNDIDAKGLADSIKQIIERPDVLKNMSTQAIKLVGKTDTGDWQDNVTTEFWRR